MPGDCLIDWPSGSAPTLVFMDVTDIAPGEDFARVIEDSVGTADLLLAMIGPQWLSASDRAGTRRLDDPSDFVRREIAAGPARRHHCNTRPRARRAHAA